jgi:hypothetical protein
MASRMGIMLFAAATVSGALLSQPAQAALSAAQPHAIIADAAASANTIVNVRHWGGGWGGGGGYWRRGGWGGWRGGW